MSPDQQALEAALVAHPDEVAAHSAYADYLAEAGDPRGEFIQTQLALEDESRPKAERTALKKKEQTLLKKHAKEWLGDVARFLLGDWSGEDKPYSFRIARGWLDAVRTLPVPAALVAALARAPEARLLRRLEVVYDMRYHPFDFDTEGPSGQLRAGEQGGEVYDAYSLLPQLAESPHLTNLRVLKYGFSDDHPGGPTHSTMVEPLGVNTAEQMIDVLKACPRLEELYLNIDIRNAGALLAAPELGNLRVLQYYYGSTGRMWNDHNPPDPYPLSALAQNKSLKNLTTLRFHPGRDATIDIDELDALLKSKNLPALAHLQIHMTTYGDDGANRLVASGILKRLKTLDIGYGNMTDDGARTLAACSDLKNLDVLTVSQNALTAAGTDALRATGITIVADDQHGIGGEEDDWYLYSVDRE